MALLNILEYPDPRLRKVAAPVAAVTPEIQKLVRDMADTMYAAPGVGLAATQVNVHKRVGFAGTPAFAARILAAIAAAGHTIPLCLTQPDRPKGRGLQRVASPVKTSAARYGIPVMQPVTLKAAEARGPLFEIPLDVL